MYVFGTLQYKYGMYVFGVCRVQVRNMWLRNISSTGTEYVSSERLQYRDGIYVSGAVRRKEAAAMA